MTQTAFKSLAPGIRSIPLINSWFAHMYLVAPSTFGHYTQYHLDLLESFVDDPSQHLESIKIPELIGGPFINYTGDPADMARFRDQTRERCGRQLHAAVSINAMYQMLLAQAKGAGVPGLYAQIDPSIRHGVELSYDVCKQPVARIIEKVLYDGPLYDPSLQTCILEKATYEPRTFVLSTPQIRRQPSSVELRLPFGDPLWNHMSSGRHGLGELMEMLRPHVGDAAEMAFLEDMFIDHPARTQADEVPAGRVRVRYFGHACVLVECAGTSVLVDPLISYPGESTLDHFTFDDLPARIDYVLITHPHQDHVVLETLLRLRDRVDHVVVGRSGGGHLPDVSLKLMLNHCGLGNVIELGEYESIAFEAGRIVGAPFYGEHADLDIRSKLAFGVEMHGRTCLFFADSNPPVAEFYEPLKRMMPKIDCLFLGMECVGAPATWLYGPLLQKMLTRGEDQSRRLDGCDSARALEMHRFFDPEHIFVYAMGAEPWLTHITSILYSEELPQFKEARILESTVRAQGRSAEVLYGKRELLL
ncbi:MAG: MBL fold metallo-hydrolase [Lysobacteraceae bacterium]